MSTKGFGGKPVWVNPDPPHVQARVAVGLKNLFAWLGVAPSGYAGPWPSAGQLDSDAAYALFLGRDDVKAALSARPGAKERPTMWRAPAKERAAAPDEPPLPTAAPDGPDLSYDPETGEVYEEAVA